LTLFDFSPHNFTNTPPGGATVADFSPLPTDVAASNASNAPRGLGSAHTGSHVTPRCTPGDLYATATETVSEVASDEVVTQICRSSVRRSVVLTSQHHVISIVLHVDEQQHQQPTSGDAGSKFIVMYEGLLTLSALLDDTGTI